ncbi:MAG: IS1380 family transposase, partial [Phycisphaeraceae bacterium]|nr:IS1380 family transposase [Phycisphaeraceae bacterium]
MGEAGKDALRVGFDRAIKLEFHGARVSSDAGLFPYRDLDDAARLTESAAADLFDFRTGSNISHGMTALLRQSIYSRLAGYEDVNDAERLSVDPVMRHVVGGRAADRHGASTSQVGRFETDVLTHLHNLAALMNMPGQWVGMIRQRCPIRKLILDMDSSVSETYGQQEGTAYNGHFGCECYHPLFIFNQDGDVERAMLRAGNVASADDWRSVLEPVIERYHGLDVRRYFRADAAFAIPELYELLEAEGYRYVIRLKANPILQEHITHLLTRPVGRPPKGPQRFYHSFDYQAQSWDRARRVVAKVEWHQGELFPRVGFTVTNLGGSASNVVNFYNRRGTAEQWIREGKHAVRWTRLSCHSFDANQVRLQLHVLAYNLGNFLRRIALPRSVKHWTLTTLREKLIKIGAKMVHHARYVTFQLAEVAIPRRLYRAILNRIRR